MRRRRAAFRLLLPLLPVLLGTVGGGTPDGTAWYGAADSTLAVQDEPGSELRVWLLTMGPGQAIWERFGHNALRLVDTTTGYDVSYNWGIFDFRQEGFVARFLRGRMLYQMAPFASEAMIEAYRASGREVVAQELALTPAEKRELRALAERNALPENRHYFYDYFLDNCSTRVRDLLDRVMGGALARAYADVPTGGSYRDHTRRLTQPDPLLFTGMDILLGSPGDREITLWEEMFVPMSLRDALRSFEVGGGSAGRGPLVLAEEVLAPARVATEPASPPSWLGHFLLVGVLGGVAFLLLGVRAARSVGARRAFGALLAAWGVVTGLAGSILVLVLFTDHRFMYWNENLFLLNPLAFALAILGVSLLARDASGGVWRWAAAAPVVLAMAGVLVGLAPFARQSNGLEIALLLPVHLGVWLGARAIRVGAAGAAPPRVLRGRSAT